MVSTSGVHQLKELPGLVAMLDGERAGLLTYSATDEGLEIITIDSLVENRGVGSALIDDVRRVVERAKTQRLWLVTTNDNLRALGFYQRRGFVLAALHRDAMDRVRAVKPEVPQVGRDGIPLRDMLELEIVLR